MKKIILFAVLVLITNILQAQVYEIDAYNGQTVQTCSGYFYDSGGNAPGAAGYYGSNENYTITFCPTIPGAKIKVTFTNFWIHNQGDILTIYNSDSPNSAFWYGDFDNTMPIQVVTALDNNPSGCLTFVFTSNATNVGPGWEATIECVVPCQEFKAILLESSPDTTDAGHIDGCPGLSVCLKGGGVYPNSGNLYNQVDSTSTFFWDFGDFTTAVGQSVCHTYNNAGGYNVTLTVKDTFGCESSNLLTKRVRISTPAFFDGTTTDRFDVCAYDTVRLLGTAVPTTWFGIQQQVAGTTFLPDGNGIHYVSSINYNTFEQGAMINSPNDFVGVCVTMEHSYLGDLNITLICPNGRSIVLKSYPGGGNTFLGEPIDVDANLNPGIGYEYCWTPNPLFGTMLQEVGQHTYTYTDLAGNTYTNHAYLPAGSYAPEQSFTNLIGCPLNGNWTIDISDNLLSDNGYIFEWGLYMQPYVYPEEYNFTPQIESYTWSGSGIVSQSDSVATVVPTTAGIQQYHLHAVNEFGCTFDTTVYIRVHPAPIVEITGDTAVCPGQPANLYLNTNATSFTWSTGQSNHYIITVYPQVNTSYTVTGNLQGCIYKDTIWVRINPIPEAIISAPESTCNLCAPLDGTFSSIGGDNTIDSYTWYFSQIDSLVGARVVKCFDTTGVYNMSLVVKSNLGCVDTAYASITISINPVVNLGPDTTLGKEASILLDAGAGNGYTYAWSNNATTQSIEVNLPGTYTVTVTNEFGCDTTDFIVIKPAEINTGNVFTPNGDGINDYFEIESIKQYPGSKLIVMNRWGKKVFESSDYKNEWDGKGCPDGTYFYILELNTGERFQGIVTILGSKR